MNTITVRKVIAREGLIVIAVLILAGVASILSYRENDKRSSFERAARVAELVEPASGPPEWKGGGTFFSPTGIHIMLQEPIDEIRIRAALKRDFPELRDPRFMEWDDQDKSMSVKHYYDSKGSRIRFIDYRTVIVVILLLYPAYWLVRFVSWSIKTLRQSAF